MTSPLPDAVLLDMDGLLVDTEPVWFAAEVEVMRRHGVTWTEEHQATLVGSSLDVTGRYLAELAGGDPIELGLELLDETISLLPSMGVRWRPGARELLVELAERKHPHALVTASARRLVDPVLAVIRDDLPDDVADRALPVIVTGDDVRRTKPHPDPYAGAAGRLGTPPGACLALEDSRNGATSARAAGCGVVVVPCVVGVSPEPGWAVVETLVGATLESLWTEALAARP